MKNGYSVRKKRKEQAVRKNRIISFLLIIVMLVGITGCAFPDGGIPREIEIIGDREIEMTVGEEITLLVRVSYGSAEGIFWGATGGAVTVTDGHVVAVGVGHSFVTVSLDGNEDTVLIRVSEPEIGGDEVPDSGEPEDAENGNTGGTNGENGGNGDSDGTEDTDGSQGSGSGQGGSGSTSGDDSDGDEDITEDIFGNIDRDDFYADYKPAASFIEASYRSEYGLMSGSIAKQDQAPDISDYRPTENGYYVKNAEMIYSADGNTYTVTDAYGNEVLKIYRGGGYVTLEEVAAYVFAFGDVPANYISAKKASPGESDWGEYLRLNHSAFSGNTSKYPYEPVLPRISGMGGELSYYEIDIGTTGTDCDPSYPATDYNNGYRIVRGAARIVYARFKKGAPVSGISDKFVFYTYNHYNDFEEYLNYLGGWGEMFGNITGGGTISSVYDYAPTPYVPVTLTELPGTLTEAAWISLPVIRRDEVA